MSSLQGRLPAVASIAGPDTLQGFLINAAHDGRTRPVERDAEQRLELGDVHSMQGERLVSGRR